MDCAQNAFCKTLPEETRAKLCSKCRRRFFKAGSMQMSNDYTQSCMLVLDGVMTTSMDLGRGMIDHENEIPMLYFGLPGRLLELNITFGYDEIEPSIGYIDFHYLTDTWVASFNHHLIRELCDEDAAFRHAVYKNMLALMADILQTAALFRSNYLYYGLYHLIEMLLSSNQYLTQQQLATLLNRDRTSVSKACSRLKKEQPELWDAYIANKGRVSTSPYPGVRE